MFCFKMCNILCTIMMHNIASQREDGVHASYGTMICLKEGIDPKVMSQGTFMSTLLSVVTIPLLALIL